MGVVRAQQEQDDWHAEQEFLCRRVLIAIINLFPHVQIVVSPCVEFKRHSSNPVEHQIGSEHVGYVRQRPRDFLSNARYDVEHDLQADDQDEVNCPGSC